MMPRKKIKNNDASSDQNDNAFVIPNTSIDDERYV
jgi:hypothetical protein